MRDHSLYLKDILAAIDAINEFTAGMNLEAFQADDKTASAVIRKLEVIGEAVKQIPDDLRAKWSGIPWKEMAGMRDRLIHFYFGVNHELVWKAIHDRLPGIRAELERMAQEP